MCGVKDVRNSVSSCAWVRIVAVATGAAHVQAEDTVKARPLRKVIRALRWLVHYVEFLHEAVEAVALPSWCKSGYTDRVGNQASRVRPEPQQPAERVDLAV